MGITAAASSNIIKLIVGMFDAAPGATYLGQFEGIITSGRGFALLTEDLSQTSAFLNLYPANSSSSDFVTSFLNTLLADNVTAENMQQAVDYVSNILAGNGDNRADAILQTLIALNNVSVDNAAFGAAAKAFANKAQVAEHYSVELSASASDVATLRSIVANIGPDDASRDLALANADAMLQTSGKLIDGYIKDATVFLDTNGNGVLDEGETSTTTDANGDFTLVGQGSLVAFGGTDISTGLAFEGTLKAPEGSTVITPVTTLVQAIVETGKSADEAEQAVSAALGLSSDVDLKTFDPIEEATKEGAEAADIETALDIQSANLKVANMLVQAAAVMQGAAGGELTAVEAMQATVEALAEKINEAVESDNTVDLADAALLEETVNSAAEKALDSIDDVTIKDGLQESVAALADEAAAILADANTSIAQALEEADADQVLEALRDAVQIQTVTQGEAADAIEDGAASGDLSDAQESFSGDSLDARAEQVELSDDSLTGGAEAEDETEEDTEEETSGSGGGGSGPSITLSYSPDTFVEASANNGTISTTSTLTLSGAETFAGTSGQALTGAVVSNVPDGLTAVVTKTSDTTATLSFTGNASSHEDLNDVSNLTVTLGDSSFTGGIASLVTGATKNNLAINFADADSIELNYDLTTFDESTANDGSITATSTLTLTGDTFLGSNGQVISDVTFSNVPAGLSASLVKASDTTATLSFSGAAASHLSDDDISNLTITLGDSAFVNSDASEVTGATNNSLSIDFADPVVKSLSYSSTSFAEATANDGSIIATSTLTLANETFAGSNGQALSGATFSNVPAGLSVSLVKASDTTATLSFSGTAGSHLNADDIANLTVTLGDSAFVGADASAVTGATTSDLAIDFADPVVKSLSYSATSFAEAVANDGSITATSTLTLTNETFSGSNGQALSGATFSNVPAGLSVSLVKASDTTATLSFSGTAGSHVNADDIANLTVTLGDAAFVGADASAVTGATTSDLAIDFADPVVKLLSYSATSFAEATANDGSITATATLTLTNETFAGSNGQALSGATFSNVPAGLSVSLVKASDTTATLSFSGTAGSHANADDISNLTVTLGDSVFVGADASSVTGATTSDLAIDFADPRTLSYDRVNFTESTSNDGTFSVTAILTLSGDTFTGVNSSALAGVTFANVPGGLTASLVKASDTTATLSFSGSASAHANASDISNMSVTLANAAFTGGNASAVNGAINSSITIDYADLGAIDTGDSGANILLGTGADDIIYGAGGADTINGAEGDDSIDITDASAASAKVVIASVLNGLDTVIGFDGGATIDGGDVLDFSAIASLSDSVATSMSLGSDFSANNVFVFTSSAISVDQAASAIAADADVTATAGYIVIADSENNDVVTVYHSDNLAADGTETALVTLAGINISDITANNILV